MVPRRIEGPDGIEMTWALNHLGQFLLTGLVLDLLGAAEAGRIVNVASRAHLGPQVSFDDPEGTSRYAAGVRTSSPSSPTSSSPIASRSGWTGAA